MAEKTIKNAWSMLIKLGAEENLKKLQSGELYMKNLQYYVDLEKGASDENVGDMYDGQMLLRDVKISMYSVDTNRFLGQIIAPKASMNLGYLKCPVFCMYMFDYRNHTGEELNGNILKVRYQFTEEQLEKLPNFGTHAFIIKNGTMVEYAHKEIKDHIGRFTKLYYQIKNDKIDAKYLLDIFDKDDIFPEIDYMIYH